MPKGSLLEYRAVLTDSSGWPCLRFEAVKVRSEQLIPLSARAAAAISAQQDHVRQRWPAGRSGRTNRWRVSTPCSRTVPPQTRRQCR